MKKKRSYAVKITTSGEMYPVHIDLSRSLAELQKHVGGYIEIVRPRYLTENTAIVVNEEGKLLNMKPNIIAAAMYGTEDVIVGDALIVKTNDDIDFFTVTEADEYIYDLKQMIKEI